MKLSRRLETYRKSRRGYSKRLRKTLILFPTEFLFRHGHTIVSTNVSFLRRASRRALFKRFIKLHIYNGVISTVAFDLIIIETSETDSILSRY